MSARFFAMLVASSVVACGALAGCAAEEEGDEPALSEGDGKSEDAIVSERQLMGGELPDKTLNLTFDDGPGERTAELAEFLAAEGIKATFFINGMNVPGRQRAIDAIIGRGHLLANHTQNHLKLTRLSAANVVREVTETDAFITQAQPQGPFLIRAPFGAWTGATSRAINRSPMSKYVGSVFWDIGGELTSTAAADWDCWGKGVSVERCGQLYLQEIRSKRRGIVLMHDVHNRTVQMMRDILPALKADGYRFAQCDEVPSVQRALAVVSAGAADDNSCSSATLGRTVPENACVQSRSNQRWSRCQGGEWVSATGGDDPLCTAGRFGL